MGNVSITGRQVRVLFTPVSDLCIRATLSPAEIDDPFLFLNGQFLSDEVKELRPEKTIDEIGSHTACKVGNLSGRRVQSLSFDAKNGEVTFPIGGKPIHGLGQGFPTPKKASGSGPPTCRRGQFCLWAR